MTICSIAFVPHDAVERIDDFLHVVQMVVLDVRAESAPATILPASSGASCRSYVALRHELAGGEHQIRALLVSATTAA